jgi:hypothetical protein
MILGLILIFFKSAQRKYYGRYIDRATSPIIPELAYKLGSTDRKQKYGKTSIKTK